MVFNLVDRVLELQPGKRIVARKEVSAVDLLVSGSARADRHLPFPLVVECLAQAGGFLIAASSGFRQRAVLGGIQAVTPGRPAAVGDQLQLVAEVESRSEEAMLFRLQATCDGDEVARVDGVLVMLVDAATLEDPAETRARYDKLCRAESFVEAHAGEEVLVDWVPYDEVGEMAPGERATAHKLIPMPYGLFDIHFARFPVVPGALVLHSLVSLGQELLAAGPSAHAWRLERMRVVKFQQYIRPQERMALEVRVLQGGAEEVQLAASASVEGRPAVILRRLVFTRQHSPETAGQDPRGSSLRCQA